MTVAFAQTQPQIDPNTQINWPNATGAGTPAGACSTVNYGQPYTDLGTGAYYVCGTTGWINVTGGGSSSGSVGTAGQVQMVGSSAGTFAASSLTDNGSTVSVSEPLTIGGTFTNPAQGTSGGTTANYASYSSQFGISYWNGSTGVADTWTWGTYICPYASCGASPTSDFYAMGPSTITATGFGVKQNSSILATSGANVPCPNIYIRGATWTGTVSQLDDWDIGCVYGTGAEPSSTLTIGKGRGTTGAANVQVNAGLIVNGGTPGFGNNGTTWTSGAGAPSANCPVGSFYTNSTAGSASTVLYLCYPANTWTAVTAP